MSLLNMFEKEKVNKNMGIRKRSVISFVVTTPITIGDLLELDEIKSQSDIVATT